MQLINPPESAFYTEPPEDRPDDNSGPLAERVQVRSYPDADTVVFDTETFRFAPGCMAPPLVCVSYLTSTDSFLDKGEVLFGLLSDPNRTFIGHNIPYDFAVVCAKRPELLPFVAKAYQEHRVFDTLDISRLVDIDRGLFRKIGGYTLAQLYWRATGRQLEKKAWRTGYSKLAETPIDEWPAGAKNYAEDDARATWAVYQYFIGGIKNLSALHLIQESNFWLHLSSCWGVRTDANFTKMYRAELSGRAAELRRMLPNFVKSDGKRNDKQVREYVGALMGDRAVTTDKGTISLAADVLEEIDDPLIEAFSEYLQVTKKLSNDIKLAMSGSVTPIHTRYGMAATTRTTSSPNLQNLNTKSKIRNCFVPRDGEVFVGCDYGSLELHTFAQAIEDMGKKSTMAELLNSGAKIHSMIGAKLLGCSWQEVEAGYETDPRLYNARQLGKCRAYGGLGGMGNEKFIIWCKRKGVIIDEKQAEESKEAFDFICDDIPWYMEKIKSNKGAKGRYVPGLGSESGRLCDTYTADCNTRFQRKAAAQARLAVSLVSRQCYGVEIGPLTGCRIAMFVHDEIIVSCPTDRAEAAGEALRRFMAEAASIICPVSPSKPGKAKIMERWTK